jgi:hypothetical protein
VSHGREWTDETGTLHTEAQLLGRNGPDIWLKRIDSRIVKVAMRRLSAADRAFVEQELANDPVTSVGPTLDSRTIQAFESKDASNGVFRLAAAQLDLPTQGAEKDDVDDHGFRFKYLYSGCMLEAQIIVGKNPPPPGVGTVSFWHTGFHRLDGLEFFFSHGEWYQYRVIFPGAEYKYWSFGRSSNCCGCYPVWAWDQSMQPHFKGWFCRERVW